MRSSSSSKSGRCSSCGILEGGETVWVCYIRRERGGEEDSAEDGVCNKDKSKQTTV